MKETTVAQTCQTIINSIRAGWTARAAEHYMLRGYSEEAAMRAAEVLWKTADIDLEPEEAVDNELKH